MSTPDRTASMRAASAHGQNGTAPPTATAIVAAPTTAATPTIVVPTIVAPVAADTAPPVAPTSTRNVAFLGVGLAVVLAGALALAIVPRRAQQQTLAAGAAAATADSTPTVSVTTVTRAPAATSLTLPGTVQGWEEAAIFARTSGYVRHVYVNIGTPVRAGQLLAVLDAPDATQNLKQGQAQLAQGQAALVLARNNYQRWQVLADSGAATAQDLDQYRSTYNAAVANQAAAQANVQRLTDVQNYTRVTAPFTGVVIARSVDEGAFVSTAGGTSAELASGGTLTAAQAASPTSLFRIAQADSVRVYVSVPQLLANSMHAGLAAQLVSQSIVPGQPYVGHVARTAHAVDPASRTLLTEVDVPNPHHAIMPGMFTEVVLQFDRTTPPLTVPSTALVVRTAGTQLLVVDRTQAGRAGSGPAPARTTGVLRYVPVQVGRDYGATVEITSGVADGATVVLNPAEGLRAGQRAYVVTTTPPSDGLTPPSATAAAAFGTGPRAGPQANRSPSTPSASFNGGRSQ